MSESRKQYLLVGLGNPGPKYAGTRHNVGFQFLDYLARQHGFGYAGSKWQAQLARPNLWGAPVLLAKPETYMNLSGQAVAGIVGYYRLAPEQVVVVHDDIDLPVGRLKIVVGRGAGGHNGIRSIIEHLGDRAFVRIRVGVGRPVGPMPVEKYVLAPFSNDELDCLTGLMARIEDAARLIISDGPVKAMNIINQD